jgi:hypothetical protein
MPNSDETTPAAHQPKRAGSDAEYTFGRPLATYLSPIEILRMTILRSKLRDAYGDLTPTSERTI